MKQMELRPIRTDDDLDWALSEIERYFDVPPEPGTEAADRFDILTDLIEAYENREYPIEALDPMEKLKVFMGACRGMVKSGDYGLDYTHSLNGIMDNRMQHRTVTQRLDHIGRKPECAIRRTIYAVHRARNEMLARHNRLYKEWTALGKPEGGKPSTSKFSLQKLFVAIRSEQDYFKEFSCGIVRESAATRLARSFNDRFSHGRPPRFNSWERVARSFDVTSDKFRITDDGVRIEKIGLLHVDLRKVPWRTAVSKALKVEEKSGNLYLHVTYAIDREELDSRKTDNGKVVGVDMNVRNVTTHDGESPTVYLREDTPVQDEAMARHQRKLSKQVRRSVRYRKRQQTLRKHQAKRAAKRRDQRHKTTTAIARQGSVVVCEDLKTQGMTKCKGKYLNRESRTTGWYAMRQMLAYKSREFGLVNPAYTSCTCPKCGHVDKNNRKTQERFECVKCGYEANADSNAGFNIRSRYHTRRNAGPPSSGGEIHVSQDARESPGYRTSRQATAHV